jgi:glycosyltransferase involved in cell wall biosynthesis
MKLRIAFVTPYDAMDRSSWSGTAFYLARAFTRHGVTVDLVGGLRRRVGWPTHLRKFLTHRPRSATYLLDRDPSVLAAYAREVDSRLTPEADMLFFPGSFPIPGFLRDRRPCVAYADGSFHELQGFYPEYQTLCHQSVAQALRAEEAALTRCDHIFYASPWALDATRERYPFIAGKSTVVPFGANGDESLGRGEIDEAIAGRGHGACKLLFVGKDWRRKRLQLVFEVMATLAGRGIDVELDMVGVSGFPTIDPSLPVRNWGLLDTWTAEGKEIYGRLLRDSDFMILPSIAECFGICLCEAASRGLPSVAAAVGGIPSVVRHGRTGYVLPSDAKPEDYADVIQAAYTDRALYRSLAGCAYEEFCARLNWDAAVEAILARLRDGGLDISASR